MSLIITCGVGRNWCDFAQQRLNSMGTGNPRQASRFGLSIERILDGMSQSIDLRPDTDPSFNEQQPIGKTWEMANADFFISNMREGNWGWADPRNVYFLDFWREFEPQAKFLLLYGTPAEYLSSLLEATPIESLDVERELEYWASHQRAILSFYHRNRDHAALTHIGALNGTAGRLSDMLEERLDVQTRRLNDQVELGSSKILQIAASNIIPVMPSQEEVLSELENSADLHRMENEDGLPELAEKALEELNQFQRLESQLNQVTENNVCLHDQIVGLQQQIEVLTAAKSQIENLKLAQDDQHSAFKRETEQRLAEVLKQLHEAETNSTLIHEPGAEHVEEVDFLSSRLLQTQAELERYFNKYQELKQNSDGPKDVEAVPVLTPPRAVGNASLRSSTNTDLVVDFREYIEGNGWYGAEAQGRWAGPALRSDLHLPPLAAGSYGLSLKVIDAMSLDILYGLKLRMNGRELGLRFHLLSDMGGKLAPLRRIKARVQQIERPFPVLIQARINPTDFDEDRARQLFSVVSPRVVSPASAGQTDDRKLSICVETLELTQKA